MKKKTTTLIALAAIASAGGSLAIAGEKKHKEAPAVKNIGEPIRCVRLRSIQSTKVIDNKTIDFKMNGRKTYRNTLDGKCPGLKSEERFSYRTSVGELCNVDIIRVLHNYGSGLQTGAACGLGKFQQIEKVKTK